MKRLGLGVLGAIVLLAGVAFLRGEAIALAYIDHQTDKRSVAELSDLLVEHMSVYEPDRAVMAAGPVPLLIQMHGCGGLNLVRHQEYADMATAAGYVVVIVSSNAPRGYDGQASLEQVCRGKALLGQERAGDIVVALEHAFSTYEIDRENIVLAGWSHGAWSVMDYLSLNMPEQLPSSLREHDGEAPQIKAAVLFYPYCGIGSRSRVHGWTQVPEVLALMGDADTVVSYEDCKETFAKLERAGAESIRQKVYEGADHAFDNAHLRGAIAHWYDADYAADAQAEYAGFLASLN